MSDKNKVRAVSLALPLLLFGGVVGARADTLVFVPGNNNFWPDPNNWYTVLLTPAGRAPVAGDSATISAHDLVDVTGLSLNLNTLTLNSDAVVSNGLVTASKVVMYAGTPGTQTYFQNANLTVLNEMDVLGGSCALYSSALTIKPGAIALLGQTGIPGQLSFTASTIYNYGQITLVESSSFLSGGTSLINETNAVISASTNATLGGTACVFDNSGTVRCDDGTFAVGPFANWTSQSGLAWFQTTSSNAVLNFPSGLTVPVGATNYFFGPGTNEWAGANVQGTAQIGFQDPTTLLFTNGCLFFSGTIAGTGAIHAAGMQGLGSVLIWYNSELAGPAVAIDSLSQMNLTDRFTHELAAGMINNGGAFNWTNGATLSIDSGAVFNNLPGGTVYCGLANPSIDGSVTGGGTLNNAGTFRKAVGTNGLVFGSSGPAFNNTGLLAVQSGYVQLSGGTNAGAFDLSGGELWLGYNPTALNAGCQFTGTDFVRVLGPGTLFVNAEVTVGNFELRNATATLDGAGNLTVSNTCNWLNGTVQGSGSFSLPSGAALNVSGPVFWSQRTINNSGLVALTGTIGTQGGGVFSNLPGGVVDFQNDHGIAFAAGAAPAFNNWGLFKKSAGSGTSPCTANFTNAAQVQIQTGTISFGSGFLQTAGNTTVSSNAVLQTSGGAALMGGTLSGLGTISGALSNAATLAPGPSGTLTIVGNYTQAARGVLELFLGGTAPGQYSRLSVSGAASLSGAILVALTNGFDPVVGDVFAVGTASAGFAGGFGLQSGLSSSNGVSLVPQIAATTLNLVAAHALTLSAPSNLGPQFTFSYPSTAGLTNSVQYTTSLSPAHWLGLTNFAGDGTLKTVFDPTATNASRFYRVLFQ